MMKLLSLKNKALGSSIDYKILPRKVKFDWKDTPVDWIPTNHLQVILLMKLTISCLLESSGFAGSITRFYLVLLMKNLNRMYKHLFAKKQCMQTHTLLPIQYLRT